VNGAPDRKLTGYWKSQGLRIPPGNSEERLRAFESERTLTLPLDFRNYLLNVDGMAQTGGHDCDRNGFAFWPLQHIRTIVGVWGGDSEIMRGVSDPDQYYIFADYFQRSWAYALRLSNRPSDPNEVMRVGTIPAETIAASFTEFVDLYLQNAAVLYPEPHDAG
jgi:hypothetical protein